MTSGLDKSEGENMKKSVRQLRSETFSLKKQLLKDNCPVCLYINLCHSECLLKFWVTHISSLYR